MQNNELHELFGLPKNFTDKQLKKKFNELVKIFHPDKGGDPEMFRKILDAYELLLKRQTPQTTLRTSIPMSPKELKECLGEHIIIEFNDQTFRVLIPYETRIGDTVKVENILPNVTLLIKVKEKNEQPT